MTFAVYRLVLRSQITRGRLAAVVVVGLGMIALGAAAGARAQIAPDTVGYLIANNFGLALLVPVTALVFASAALGDPTEDGTLVYLWLHPVARWRLAGAAVAATLTVVLPLTLLPIAASTLLTRASLDLTLGALAAAAVAAVAYSSVFVGVGLVVQRALAWGLAYLLIWEGVVAGIGTGPARLSVRLYADSILRDMTGRDPGEFGVSLLVGVLVPVCVAVAAFVLTSVRLGHQDVK